MMPHPQSPIVREGMWLRTLKVVLVLCVAVVYKRCKTCDHIFVGSTFSSNVTGKSYNVRFTGKNVNCGTKNVIYLISCRKCVVQYVGETSQTLHFEMQV